MELNTCIGKRTRRQRNLHHRQVYHQMEASGPSYCKKRKQQYQAYATSSDDEYSSSEYMEVLQIQSGFGDDKRMDLVEPKTFRTTDTRKSLHHMEVNQLYEATLYYEEPQFQIRGQSSSYQEMERQQPSTGMEVSRQVQSLPTGSDAPNGPDQAVSSVDPTNDADDAASDDADKSCNGYLEYLGSKSATSGDDETTHSIDVVSLSSTDSPIRIPNDPIVTDKKVEVKVEIDDEYETAIMGTFKPVAEIDDDIAAILGPTSGESEDSDDSDFELERKEDSPDDAQESSSYADDEEEVSESSLERGDSGTELIRTIKKKGPHRGRLRSTPVRRTRQRRKQKARAEGSEGSWKVTSPVRRKSFSRINEISSTTDEDDVVVESSEGDRMEIILAGRKKSLDYAEGRASAINYREEVSLVDSKNGTTDRCEMEEKEISLIGLNNGEGSPGDRKNVTAKRSKASPVGKKKLIAKRKKEGVSHETGRKKSLRDPEKPVFKRGRGRPKKQQDNHTTSGGKRLISQTRPSAKGKIDFIEVTDEVVETADVLPGAQGKELESGNSKPKPSEDYDPFEVLFDSISGKRKDGQQLQGLYDAIKKKDVKDDNLLGPIPLKFRYGVEEPKPVEKSPEEIETAELFSELDFGLLVSEMGCYDLSNRMECPNGEHDLVLDEEVGEMCKYCAFIREINYVLPPLGNRDLEEPGRRSSLGPCGDPSAPQRCMGKGMGNGMGDGGYSSNAPISFDQGTVWDLLPGIRRSLYHHQQEGFEFMWRNIGESILLKELQDQNVNNIGGGCIISHAPGTGKTRLTIVFLQTYVKLYPKGRPVIIAPASMLLTWEEEFKKWNVDIPFHNLNNNDLSGKEDREILKNSAWTKHGIQEKDFNRMVKLCSWSKGNSILGVSYSLYGKLAADKKEAEGGKLESAWRKALLECPGLLVLDEGHTPRNQRSLIWQALSKVQTTKRIILSGTPFQNNFVELFNTMCIVRPLFAKTVSKDKAFADLVPVRRKKFNPVHIEGDEGIMRLKAEMASFVHVHKGSILQESLPGLRDCVMVLRPQKLQGDLIQRIEGNHNTFEFEHKVAMISAHPSLYLSCKLSAEECSEYEKVLLEQIKFKPEQGVKTRFLMEMIRLSNAMNEKVLVFSQYIDPLSMIKDQLISLFGWAEGREILYMYGRVDQKERQGMIGVFNDPKSSARVLLASTRATSEGINLVGASRVVLIDVVWNPSVERQAISRAYRLGQEKVVYTYHLLTSGTTEGEKYYRQAVKDRISELVFSSAEIETDRGNNTAIMEDKILEEMIGHAKLKDMFERIIYQPKDTNLVDTFGSVDPS